MAMRREELYKLIETVPEEKLEELSKIIKVFTIPEEEPTKEEIQAINETQKEYETGKTLPYTIEQLREELLENE